MMQLIYVVLKLQKYDDLRVCCCEGGLLLFRAYRALVFRNCDKYLRLFSCQRNRCILRGLFKFKRSLHSSVLIDLVKTIVGSNTTWHQLWFEIAFDDFDAQKKDAWPDQVWLNDCAHTALYNDNMKNANC